MAKYAIAKTYGLTILKEAISYVKKLTPKQCQYTALASQALLFDTIDDAIKFGVKKGWKIADHYIRSSIYVQEVDDDMIYRGYTLVDDGNNNLIKMNIELENEKYFENLKLQRGW